MGTRGTLHPLYALPMGLEYCDTVWALELDDHAAFFRPRAMPVPAGMARILGIPAGQPVAYFPRRSYDLWGARLLRSAGYAGLVEPPAASPRSSIIPN